MVARKPWIGGNWKCNGSLSTIEELSKAFNEANFSPESIDVVIFPTAIHIDEARSKLDKKYHVGSQNVSATGNGAHTGEISADILKDMNVEWTLIGHSERRTLYNEHDSTVDEKLKMCEKAGIKYVICFGETLDEREAGKTLEVCKRQLKAVLKSVTNWSNVVFAYEPVWAIGTGKVATKEQAEEVHKAMRSYIAEEDKKEHADAVRIVYGGSVNEKNCAELAGMPNIDGFLVGGASLKPAFTAIISSLKDIKSN